MAALLELAEASCILLVDLAADILELFGVVLLLVDLAGVLIDLNDFDHGLPQVKGCLLHQVSVSILKKLDEGVGKLSVDPHEVLEGKVEE